MTGECSSFSEDFARRLVVIEKAMIGVEQRLVNLEVDQAVEAFLLTSSNREVCQTPEQSEAATLHAEPSENTEPTMLHGGSGSATLPRHPVLSESAAAIFSNISGEMTKLKDELRSDLLSELSLQVERQLATHHNLMSMQANEATQYNSVPSESGEPQGTSPSIDPIQSVTGLRVPELPLSQPRGTVRSSRRNSQEYVAQLREVPSESLANDLDEASGEIVFSGSIWDAALLLGVRPMGNVAALQLFMLFLINICVQVIYIILVQEELTSPKFDEDRARGFRDFRTRIAHSSKWLDVITGDSLAARLCASDADLHMASSQSDVLNDIQGYLPQRDTLFGEVTGQMMCALALIVWSLVGTKEIRTVCMTFLAVRKRSVEGEESSRTKIKLNGEQWVFSSFSRVRLSVISAVLLIRLLLACFLLRAGMKWLTYTINLENLILNAMALECILQFDELLFETLTPQRVVALCDQFEPLPLPKLDCRGIDLSTMFGLMFVNGLVFYVGFRDMFENVDLLKRADAELCGGELNFIYQDSPFPPYFQWSPTSAGVIDVGAEDLIQRIVQGEYDYPMIIETKYPGSAGSSWSLQLSAKWDMEYWAKQYNPTCKTLLDMNTPAGYFNTMNIRFPTEAPVASCIDIRAHCDADTSQGINARTLCPQTCGCDNPFSHLVLGITRLGCPTSCRSSHAYEQARNTTNCVDMNWTVLSTFAPWLYYANHVVAIAKGENNTGSGWLPSGIAAANATKFAMLGRLHVVGCPILPFLFNTHALELCNEDQSSSLRTLQFYCPQTCKCTRDRANCPRSCPAPFVIP